jgi:hypothetical protein
VTEDQREQWRKAIADSHRQQRNRRGRRKTGLAAVTQPGMVRLPPPSERATGTGPTP